MKRQRKSLCCEDCHSTFTYNEAVEAAKEMLSGEVQALVLRCPKCLSICIEDLKESVKT